jgi:hypothetical protein
LLDNRLLIRGAEILKAVDVDADRDLIGHCGMGHGDGRKYRAHGHEAQSYSHDGFALIKARLA